MAKVSTDSRAVLIDGKRTLILGGAIHYPRSTPQMWPDLMRRSREAGLNTVETYVFWNLHERRRGVFDFSGRLDLLRYLHTAQELGLHVVLRIGPYICAETNFGGFPAWLRDVPGLQVRTNNEAYKREMARWTRFVCDNVRPMFASQGGPIILAQVENEYGGLLKDYGDEGRKYLEWCVELTRSLDVGVPWFMCLGAVPGILETMNAFYAHTLLDEHFAKRPGQPPIWSENWMSCYDNWGYRHHFRPTEDVAYALARFVAAGGTGNIFYMWHGGTNFGRETSYLQATRYDFEAPLDEYGLPTTKSNHLARLHGILAEHAETLLSQPPPKPLPLGEKQCAYTYGEGESALAFLCNDATEAPARVTHEGRDYTLSPHSVIVLRGGRELMNTAQIQAGDVVKHVMRSARVDFTGWLGRQEPFPQEWPPEAQSRVAADEPSEQLALTRDETDYCWYSCSFKVGKPAAGRGTLTIPFVGDVAHVFVDGRLRATSAAPLPPLRGPTAGDGFRQSFDLSVTAGEHELDILCCALGLNKADWMLGHTNQVTERKGLRGPVLWNGKPIPGRWVMQPGLLGEVSEPMSVIATNGLRWVKRSGKPLCWWWTSFLRPNGDGPFALNLTGMNKGMAWLNGHCLGRYWLTPTVGESADWYRGIVHDAPGKGPTQQYYHLPVEWLTEYNVLLLFEELDGEPEGIRVVQWR